MIKTLSQALRMDKNASRVRNQSNRQFPSADLAGWNFSTETEILKNISGTYRYQYYIAVKDNKTEMFLDYSELLKFFSSAFLLEYK